MVDSELLKKLIKKVHWVNLENLSEAKGLLTEIDSELKLFDETRKILSSLTTSDTQKIDKIDLLLSEGGL